MNSNIFNPIYSDDELINKIFKNISKIIIFRYINNYCYNDNIKNNYKHILEILNKNFNKNYYYSVFELDKNLFSKVSSGIIEFVENKKFYIKVFLSKKMFANLTTNFISQSIDDYPGYKKFICIQDINIKKTKLLLNKYADIEFFKEAELLTNFFNTDFIPKFKIIKNEIEKNNIRDEFNVNFSDMPKNAIDVLARIGGAVPGDIIEYDVPNETTAGEIKYRYVINVLISDKKDTNDEEEKSSSDSE